jgi:hypothetical protein
MRSEERSAPAVVRRARGRSTTACGRLPDAVFDASRSWWAHAWRAMVEIGAGPDRRPSRSRGRGYQITVEIGSSWRRSRAANLSAFRTSTSSTRASRGGSRRAVTSTGSSRSAPSTGSIGDRYRSRPPPRCSGPEAASRSDQPAGAPRRGRPVSRRGSVRLRGGGADLNATQAPHPDEIAGPTAELEATGLFARVDVRRLLWSLDFDADGYTRSSARTPPTAQWTTTCASDSSSVSARASTRARAESRSRYLRRSSASGGPR